MKTNLSRFQATSSSDPPRQSTSETVTATSSLQPTSNPAHHQLATGPIVGITLGVLSLMCLVLGVLVLLFLRRRGRRRELSPGAVVDPTEDKPDSQGYLPDALSPASLQRTSPDGIDHKRLELRLYSDKIHCSHRRQQAKRSICAASGVAKVGSSKCRIHYVIYHDTPYIQRSSEVTSNLNSFK
jgi:hypothetical protein